MAQTTQSTPQIVPVEGRVHISFDDAEIASSTKAQRLERAGMAIVLGLFVLGFVLLPRQRST